MTLIVFAFRWTGAALASGVMGFPLMVRAIRLSIDAVDHRLQAAAGTLGAHPLSVGARRVWRNHHLRVQHPRTDANAFGGDLHADASSERRGRRVRLTLIAVSIALTALIAWEILQRRTSRQYRPIE